MTSADSAPLLDNAIELFITDNNLTFPDKESTLTVNFKWIMRVIILALLEKINLSLEIRYISKDIQTKAIGGLIIWPYVGLYDITYVANIHVYT